MKSKECVAMILAGGQGSRLGILTKNVAKPAVPFGGKYRIIDFPLSNCSHSGIDTVGVLTQYQPLELNTYIGSGSSWDLNRKDGGVYVLPPYQTAEKGEWYKGTANAIYQNKGFIDQYNPEYVVILSGDHIYKMDYSKMLSAHKAAKADATIAVIEVPWDEASRFGIMNTDENMRITEFAEKPKDPKSNLASMGVYVFSWPVLKKYLIADENDPNSENDFGKNIIPNMLGDGRKMLAYRFAGYWKDVGTIQSLWEANMELLDETPAFEIGEEWKIYSKNPALPPHYIGENAKVKNCFMTEGCEINGTVERSIIFEGVTVEEGAVVKESILFPNSYVGHGTIVNKAIVGNDSVLCDGVKIGTDADDALDSYKNLKICSEGISVIGVGVTVEEGIKIAPQSMVTRSIKNKSEKKD